MEDKSRQPLISIVTVVRNGEKHIAHTIKSVTNQTYKNIEYIIIDGVSVDNTLNIIKEYEKSIYYWRSEPDKGVYDAMNKGAKVASGDYLLYLNADDYLASDTIVEEVVSKIVKQAPSLPMFIGRIRIALEGEPLDWFLPINKDLMHRHNPPHQGTFIASSIYKKIFYNPDWRNSSDSMFWEELRRRGLFEFAFTDDVISVFRLGGDSSRAIKWKDYKKFIKEHLEVYKYSKEFGLLKITFRIIIGTSKIVLFTMLGEKIYYKYLIFNIYRIKKFFLA